MQKVYGRPSNTKSGDTGKRSEMASTSFDGEIIGYDDADERNLAPLKHKIKEDCNFYWVACGNVRTLRSIIAEYVPVLLSPSRSLSPRQWVCGSDSRKYR